MNTIPRAKEKTGEGEYVTHDGKHLRQDAPLQTTTSPAPASDAAMTTEGPPQTWAQFESSDDAGAGARGQPEDAREWAHFTDSSSKLDTSSVSSQDSAESADVWTITAEQRDYYVAQFKTMEADVRGVISGAVAKEFFERSRLPVQQLSKIWQLADVNRDGALSLEEFCTAMHLVVLRRNDIELPDHLPPALLPYVPLHPDEPFAADLPPGSTIGKKPSPIVPGAAPQQWYRGPESPASSAVSSPGSKPTPVNFDYKPITADGEIVHPVALRMSPDGLALGMDGDEEDPEADPDQPEGPPALHGRPRPKKSLSVPGPEPRLLPPASDRPTTLPVTEQSAAPRLPQRPAHTRGSSLGSQLIDFSETDDRLNQTAPGTEAGDATTPPPSVEMVTSTPAKGLVGAVLECKELRDAIRKQQMRNATLNRVNSELNQELQEVMEQRIALEIQLEHLRPITMGKGQFFVNLI